jgi:wyosine [tRNA(Phe)-imidazoG37] synthetase (radical SAM superfamily)
MTEVSAMYGRLLRADLDTSKPERAAFSLSGEPFVSEAWDLGDLVCKV